MIAVPMGVLFLGLFVMALPAIIGGLIGAVLSPFYWTYRLIRYLIGVAFRVARGLRMLGRFLARVGRFGWAQQRRAAGEPSNVVDFRRYRKGNNTAA
jgi:hypothetical protein